MTAFIWGNKWVDRSDDLPGLMTGTQVAVGIGIAVVAALIPDLDRWPPADRRRLVEVMRAKGGASEARYVRLLDGHARLRRSLEALAPAGG